MARTFRRKTRLSYFERDWHSYHEGLKYWYRKQYPDLSDCEIIRRKAVDYHSDNHSGVWTCPNYFGRMLDKKASKKNALKLLRALREDIDFVPVLSKKDQGYIYF